MIRFLEDFITTQIRITAILSDNLSFLAPSAPVDILRKVHVIGTRVSAASKPHILYALFFFFFQKYRIITL